MSMIARFVQVTPEVLKQYVDDPSEIAELFEEEAPQPAKPAAAYAMSETMREAAMQRAPQMLASTLERLDPAMREALKKRMATLGYDVETAGTPKGAEDLAKLMQQRVGAMMAQAGGHSAAGGTPQSGPAPSLSIDKAWHGVHYLLCGEAEPGTSMLSRAVMGGSELGDDDYGYGPARYFDTNEVAQVASEMSRAELEKEMRARFNPGAMSRAGIYPSSSWAAPDRDWLIGEFRRLRDFYAEAAARGNAVMTCIV